MNLVMAVVLTVTAWCPCYRCTGKHSPEVGGPGLTHSGTKPQVGWTLASRRLPIGTVLIIEGLPGIGPEGSRMVVDRGGPKDGGIDVYFATHNEALRFGVQRLRVTIVHRPEKGR